MDGGSIGAYVRGAGGTGGMPDIVLGSTGGQQELLGSDSWKALILGPVTGK